MPQENEHREKIVSGNVKTTKKSKVNKLMGVFISEDIQDVKSYIFNEVLVPGLKTIVYNLIQGSLEMTLFGDRSSGLNSSRKSNIINLNRTPYNKMSSKPYDRTTRVDRTSANNDSLYYEDIIFETRGDASVVLAAMEEIIDEYGMVSIAELYDLAGISTNNYQLKNFGWMNLVNARVEFTRDGYVIRFPKAHSLK